MTVLSIIIVALRTVPKDSNEDRKSWKSEEEPETIQTTEETCCHLEYSEGLLANTGVKKSQTVIIIWKVTAECMDRI